MMQRAVILPTLCWNRNHADFYAVTSDISLDGIAFRSATVPSKGDRLTCSIRHVGSIEVEVVETGVNTFIGKPTGGRRRSAALVQVLTVLAREQEPTSERQRVQPRIVPAQLDLTVTMEDGSILTGRLVNVSASGAAVQLGIPVVVGTRVRLGSTEAVVVRTRETIIGASFRSPFDPAVVNESLVL